MKHADTLPIQPNLNQKIWRYMSFEKFIFALHHRVLFFPQVKHFEDPLEGFYSDLLDYSPESDIFPALQHFFHAPNGPKAYCVISCWHMNDFESAAMWRLYTVADQGIAIQSTVNKLIESLDFSVFSEVHKGIVEYHRSAPPPPGPDGKSQILDYFNKRESFSHEQEYRILGIVKDLNQVNELGGTRVSVDLQGMIETIYISPKTESWVVDLVKSLVKKTYSLDVPVIQSSLYKAPFS